MKQVFRPIGQCLTTAVVTSAMLESYALPLLANPNANFSPPQPAESSDSTVQTNAAPLIQPEVVAPPETVVVPPALTEIRVEPTSASAADVAPVAEPSADQNSTVGETSPAESGSSQSNTNSGTDTETNAGSVPEEAGPTQIAEPAEAEAIANAVALESARQELAGKLEAIVEQDKPEREAEFRQNLVISALHYAEVGEFDQARQVAQHPALPTEIQTEVLTKIAEIEAVAAQQPQIATAEGAAIAQAPTALAPLSYPVAGYSNIGARTLPPGLAGYQGDRCLVPAVTPAANSSKEIVVNLSGIKLAATPSTLTPDQQLASLLTVSNAANETINLIQSSKVEKLQLGQVSQEPIALSTENSFSQEIESEETASADVGLHKPSAERWGEVKLDRVVGSTLDSLLNKVGITTIPAVFDSMFLGQSYLSASEFEQAQQTIPMPSTEVSSERMESLNGEPNLEANSAALPDITVPSMSIADPTRAIALGQSSPLEGVDKGFGKVNAIAPLQYANWQKPEAENPFAVLAASTGSINCAVAPGRFTGYSVTTAVSQQFSRIGLAFPLPIPAALTSAFGWRIHPISGDRRFHAGVDLGAPQGTPVVAAVSGRVAVADYMGGYGLTVVLENQDVALRNLYAHLSGIAVQPGAWIEQGSVIGWVGSTGNSTGPHLHFEAQQLTANGWVAVDPLASGALTVARAQQ
ncbi:M23 family metallopeptidase [Leptolyngbya sp. FACHB-541]|uniref:M23 family metallopeptidase n=1 Tax=Leptolyngbya sp. FACHB-541 TaxID=2692810 RepID=UPI001F54AE80|nr:M23 family metallopeptidase [Leptolyngbya sp. FACHB-541]